MNTDKNADELLIESTEPGQSKEYVEKYLLDKQQELLDLGEGSADGVEKANLQLDIAEAMVGLNRGEEAWTKAREAFDVLLAQKDWEGAVKSCDVLYQSGQPASLVALGHGVWLAVTFPIDPQLSVNMLSYIVDETPAKADGSAVAAIVAHYIADARTEGKAHESLTFLTKEMVANVAREHSGVEDQDGLSAWMERLGLHDPEDFLPKLSLVLGAIVPADQWWYDRDRLRKNIPG